MIIIADAYQGEITSVSKGSGSLKVKCTLGKKKMFGYLHEHDAEISFADNPMKDDKFLEQYLKQGKKIKVIFG